MDVRLRILIGIGLHLILLLSGVCIGATVVSTEPNTMGVVPDRWEVPYTDAALCGVRSVSVALSLLGIECDLRAVQANMPPGVYGNSMKQIVAFLGRYPELECAGIRCGAREFCDVLDAGERKLAIVHINDHWVVARRTRSEDVLEIIDYPRRYCVPVDVIGDLWEGFAVVVHHRRLLSPSQRVSFGVAGASLFGMVVILLCRKRGHSRRLP